MPKFLYRLPDPILNATAASSNNKLIPRIIWIAVKDVYELPNHLKAFFKRNWQWQVIVCDNDCKEHFMNTTMANTSVSWAFNVINPLGKF